MHRKTNQTKNSLHSRSSTMIYKNFISILLIWKKIKTWMVSPQPTPHLVGKFGYILSVQEYLGKWEAAERKMQTSVTNESTPQQERGEHSFSHFLFKVSQTHSVGSPVSSDSQEGLSSKSKELGKLPQWQESGFLSTAAQH